MWRILLQVHFNGIIVSRSVSCPPLPATLICWQWGAWSNLGIYEKNEGRKLVWVWHFAAKMPVWLRLWCWADLRLEHFYRSLVLQFLFAKMLKVESLSGSKFPFAPESIINKDGAAQNSTCYNTYSFIFLFILRVDLYFFHKPEEEYFYTTSAELVDNPVCFSLYSRWSITSYSSVIRSLTFSD